MKTLFTLAIVFAISFNSTFAQVNSVGFKARNFSYENNLRSQALKDQIEKIMIESRQYELSDINGSPFLYEDFRVGEAFLGSESIGKNLFRYNIYSEEFELKNDEESLESLRPIPSLSIILKDELFVYRDYTYKDENKKGYFMVLSNGNKAALLLKEFRTFKNGFKAQSSYQKDVKPKFLEKDALFLEKKSSKKTVELKKLSNKKLLSLLGNDKALKNFIDSNELNAKKTNDLVKIIDFYNTL